MPGKQENLERLKQTVERSFHSPVSHVCTEQVREVSGGRTLWAGQVEVFRLEKHAKARRCFAWLDPKAGIVAILDVAPVTSPATAVRLHLKLCGKAA